MTSPLPKWPRNTLLVLQAAQLFSLAPWLMVAALSFMVFDAPGSDQNKLLWTFVIAVWTYPLWLLLADIASWILLRAYRRATAAVVLCGLFTLPAILLLLWGVFLVGLSAFA